MARIRSVKPELRTNRSVAEWPREVRYFWVLLAGYLDDEGRGLDDARCIAADCFPLDPGVTEKKLASWVALIASTKDPHTDVPYLCRFVVDGRAYLHDPDWKNNQKVSHPNRSRIPLCPVHEDLGSGTRKRTGVIPESFAKDSGTVPSSRTRGTREQGNEGTGERGGRGTGERGTAAAAAARGRTKPAATAPAEPGDPPEVDLPGEVARLKSKLDVRRLQVRWDKLTASELAEVVDLVAVHGDEHLVSAAIGSYRAEDPPVFAQAWLGHWRALAPPGELRAVPPPPRCPTHLLDRPCRGCAADRKASTTGAS